MYIKLTRFDNTPVWINAAFVVTVEPRRQNVGSIVVPIGDGLDYEVRESPEAVLALLDGAPPATVVPVPPPKSLPATPADVSAEPLTMTADDVFAMVGEKGSAPEFSAPAAPGDAGEAPAKKPAKKPRKPRARKSAPVLDDEQLARLRKLAPGSVRKLSNTLSTQFKVEAADAAIDALVKAGIVTLERDRVIWSQSSANSGASGDEN